MYNRAIGGVMSSDLMCMVKQALDGCCMHIGMELTQPHIQAISINNTI